MERVDIANATGTEVSLDLPTSTARLVIERYPQAAGHIKSSLIHRFSERIKNILDAYDPPAQQVDRIASRTTETLGALSIFMFMDYMQDGLVNLFGLFS
ncbi:hypothetical protein [Alicyclobacillus shizuokensis]|uniref:hypothetical protein n=1 Tax=Alicyclobacillus shizuokensis TaxID=392014 RepID=UPI0012EE12A2|nr:hypothetical protein [Alicyclobacillus shizuokensis]